MKVGNRKSRNPVLVAEAGSRDMKVLEINRSRKQEKVSKILLKSLDPSGEDTVSGLSKAFKQAKFSGIPAIACLPRQAVTVRLLDVPSTDASEIADMVELQIGKLTPYSRDEIVADYRIVGTGRKGYTRIMLIIVLRSLMNQRFRLLEDAGLEVEGMSVSSEGILNWYCFNYGAKKTGETAVLLDVDGGYTDFVIISGDRLVFTKSIVIGADQLKGKGADLQDKFAQEVKNSIELYKSESSEESPLARVILTGAGPGINGLEAALGDRLKLPVESVDSLRGFKKSGSIPGVGADAIESLSVTALAGMALAPENLQFNLVPETVSLRRNLELKARRLTTLGILITAVLAVSSAFSMTALQKRVQHLTGLKRERDATSEQAREVEKMKATSRMVMERLDSRRAPVNIMLELHRLTPPGRITYEAITVETGQRLILKGKAGAYTDIDTLQGNLGTSDIVFKDISRRGESKTPDGKIRFEMVCSAATGGEAQ